MDKLTSFTIDKERLEQDIKKMSTFIDETKPGWTRRSFTSWHESGRRWLRTQMESCGMETEIDAASNLIGRIPGSDLNAAPIVIGSHTDTVMGGGRFDGIIGVLAGLEIARRLKETGTILRHTLEVIDFTAEEVSDFGISVVGSRGMVNNLSNEMLNRKNSSGLALKDAIKSSGGNPELIVSKSRKKGDVSLYLELHIEQGPVLDQTNNELAIVTGIVGIQRHRVTVEGAPNHAGTTPMNMRFDALPGASEMVQLLESLCKEDYGDSLVGTVGNFNVEPNGANTIPGRVVFDLEIRSLNTDLLEKIMSKFNDEITKIANKRSLSVKSDCLSKVDAIHIDNEIQEILEKACAPIGKTIHIPSGAGHDGNQIVKISPIGMIFIPSENGRSHCPEEWTDYSDVALGAKGLARALLLADKEIDGIHKRINSRNL